MELVLIIAALVALLVIYISLGAILKFTWGWFPIFVGIGFSIYLYVSTQGWTGGLYSLASFVGAIFAANIWQSSSIYFKVEEALDKAFYFED